MTDLMQSLTAFRDIQKSTDDWGLLALVIAEMDRLRKIEAAVKILKPMIGWQGMAFGDETLAECPLRCEYCNGTDAGNEKEEVDHATGCPAKDLLDILEERP